MYYSPRSQFSNICILCERAICGSTSHQCEAGDSDVNKSSFASGFSHGNSSELWTAFQKCFSPKESCGAKLIDELSSIDEIFFCSVCAKLLEEWRCGNLAQNKASRMSHIKATLSSKLLSTEGAQLASRLEKCDFKPERDILLLVKSVRHQLRREYAVRVKVEKLQDNSALSSCSRSGTRKTEKKINHQRDVDTTGRLQCSFPGCSYGAINRSKLTTHRRIHTDEKPFTCPQEGCSFRSNWKKSYTDHQRTHQRMKHKPFACSFPNCDYRAYQPYQVKNHHEIKHTQGSRACPFPGCEFRTKWEQSLRTHSVIHEEDEEKRRRFVCDYAGCDRRYTQPNNLRNHKQVTHVRADAELFSCKFPGCNYKGKAKHYLKKHEELHGPKKHQCPQCPRRFHEKEHLKTHVRIHSEEKPFPCSYPSCIFRARIKDALRKHEKTHENLRPFPCTFPGCNYRASENRLRKQHEATHDPFRAKLYECSFCARGFSVRTNLRAHIKRHVNETTHSCDQCDYATFTVKELNSHVERIHRNPKKRRAKSQWTQQGIMENGHGARKDKLFKCKYCDFSSDLTSGLGNHLAFKHPEKQVIALS